MCWKAKRTICLNSDDTAHTHKHTHTHTHTNIVRPEHFSYINCST